MTRRRRHLAWEFGFDHGPADWKPALPECANFFTFAGGELRVQFRDEHDAPVNHNHV